MIDKDLQKARQDWFLAELRSLKIDNAQADIVDKTGYKKQTINGYAKNIRPISLDFMRTFCEAYGYNFEAVNHLLIEKIKNEIVEGQTVPNKAENSKEKNSKKLSGNKDNLLNSQLTINEDDMHTINLEMVRHIMKMNEELIQTNGVLARKIPDLKEDEAERQPVKERRASR